MLYIYIYIYIYIDDECHASTVLALVAPLRLWNQSTFFFQSDIFLSFEFVVRMVVPSIYSSFIVCYFGSSAPESKRDSGKKTTAPVSKPTAADRYETIDITQMGTSIYSHYEV